MDLHFFDVLKSALKKSIPVIEVDAHINDPAFADKVFVAFMELIEKN
jgi:uncharacterized protein (UPF0261 family)